MEQYSLEEIKNHIEKAGDAKAGSPIATALCLRAIAMIQFNALAEYEEGKKDDK